MHDSRIEERIKSFKTINSNICKRREEFSLSLRKDKLFNFLMEKRLNTQSRHTNKDIEMNENQLNIPQIMKDTYEKASQFEKIDYLIKWILEEESPNSENPITSDIKKFSYIKFNLITEDLNLNTQEQDLDLDNNLIEVMLYDLFESRESSVKLEISQILLNLSYNSKNISEMLFDVDFLNKFIELTYSNNFQLVENALLILGNVIEDNSEQIEFIITKVPIVYRMKELIQYDKYDGNEIIRINLLWLIKCFVSKLSTDKFIMFVDFVPSFIKYFQMNYVVNEEILFNLLQIISRLSSDDKFLADKFISLNVMKHILDILNTKNLLRDYIVLSVRILGNLMYRADSVVDYLIQSKILQIFEKLLNTYRNSVNSQDNYVLFEVIWALSNITAGTVSQVEAVILSNIPKIILNLNKFKKNNKILKESIAMFYAAIYKGNISVILEIMKLDVVRLFCEAVNNSEDAELIDFGLSSILRMIEWSISEFNSYSQIKDELMCHNTINRIERLSNHKNQQISTKAVQILNLQVLINNDENKMDYEGI